MKTVCLVVAAIIFLAVQLPAQPTYDEGLALYKSEKYDEAAKALQSFADKNPKDPMADDAEYYITLCHWNREDYYEYIWRAYLIYTRYPQSQHWADMVLGTDSYQELGDQITAQISRYKALAGESTDPSQAEIAQYKLGLLYDIRAMRADYHAALETDEKNAIEAYTQFLSKYPESTNVPKVYFRLACVSRGTNPDACRRYHEHVQANYPGTEEARRSLYFLGVYHIFQYNNDDALKVFGQYLEQYPDSDVSQFALFSLAEVYTNSLQDRASGILKYREHLDKYDIAFSQVVTYHLALAYDLQEDYLNAAQSAQACLHRDPRNMTLAKSSIPLIMSGYGKQADGQAALLDALKDVVVTCCDTPELVNLAVLQFGQVRSSGEEQIQKTVDLTRKLITDNRGKPCESQLWTLLQRTCSQGYEAAKADKVFRETCSSIGMATDEAVKQWLTFLIDDGKCDDAADIAKGLLAENPKDPILYPIILAIVGKYSAQTSFAKAVELLDLLDAVPDLPKDFVMQSKLQRGTVAIGMDDHDLALKILQEVVDQDTDPERISKALFFQGLSAMAQYDFEKAKEKLNTLISLYPSSTSAASAQATLQNIGE